MTLLDVACGFLVIAALGMLVACLASLRRVE
jgi:hypothetical protein